MYKTCIFFLAIIVTECYSGPAYRERREVENTTETADEQWTTNPTTNKIFDDVTKPYEELTEKPDEEKDTKKPEEDKDTKKPGEDKESKKPEENENPKKPEENNEPKKSEDLKDPKKPEENKNPKKPDEDNEPKKPEDLKDPKKPEENKDPKTPKEDKETKKPEEDKETKKPEDLKDPKKPEENNEPKKPEDLKDPKEPEENKNPKKPDGDNEPKKTEDLKNQKELEQSSEPTDRKTEATKLSSKNTEDPVRKLNYYSNNVIPVNSERKEAEELYQESKDDFEKNNMKSSPPATSLSPKAVKETKKADLKSAGSDEKDKITATNNIQPDNASCVGLLNQALQSSWETINNMRPSWETIGRMYNNLMSMLGLRC